MEKVEGKCSFKINLLCDMNLILNLLKFIMWFGHMSYVYDTITCFKFIRLNKTAVFLIHRLKGLT